MSFGKFRGSDSSKSLSSGWGESSRGEGNVRPFVKGAEDGATGTTVIGKGSAIQGVLRFQGNASLHGQIEGEIHSEGVLILEEGSTLKGKIFGSEVVIKGFAQADVVAKRLLSLCRPGRLVGNVSCGRLSVEEGVVFEGTCVMTQERSAEVAHLDESRKVGATA